MIKLGLQFFGGRGSSSGGNTSGSTRLNIKQTESLLSASGKRNEINSVMNAVKRVADDYGVTLDDIQIATLGGRNQNVMAYYDSKGNLAVNKNYFDGQKMNDSYDACVKSGFHPSRGNKSGLEAVASHELGHTLTEEVGRRLGYGDWELDKASNKIMQQAKKIGGYDSVETVRKFISGYGKKSNAEAVAEAFADVYCNGSMASKASRSVVSALNSYFGR